MSKYKASIIIPTYNRSKLLKLTLDSILKQNISMDLFEVIIIDDGSTDNTKTILTPYFSELNLKYFFQENKGYRAASARNIGIINSDAFICIFIDCGILLAPNAIEQNILSHTSNTNENFAILGYLYGFDENEEHEKKLLAIGLDAFNVNKNIESIEKENILDLREDLYQELGDNLSVWPAPWAIFWVGFSSVRKDVLLDVGMFDESFNTWGGEDTDLGVTLYKNNVKIVLNRNIKGIHYPHEKFQPTLSTEELKKYVTRKKTIIHNKHNLYSTKMFINANRSTINQLLNQNKNII